MPLLDSYDFPSKQHSFNAWPCWRHDMITWTTFAAQQASNIVCIEALNEQLNYQPPYPCFNADITQSAFHIYQHNNRQSVD